VDAGRLTLASECPFFVDILSSLAILDGVLASVSGLARFLRSRVDRSVSSNDGTVALIPEPRQGACA
jgi:hypothetical protein